MPEPTQEELEQAKAHVRRVEAMMIEIVAACPPLGGADGSGRGPGEQQAIGDAIAMAAKWFADLDRAFEAGKGQVGHLVAAEAMAYGALAHLLGGTLHRDDVRGKLFAAGAAVGKMLADRWDATARRSAIAELKLTSS